MTATTSVEPNALPLLPVERPGRLAGLRTLVHRELGEWWRTRLWWIQALIWIALLNGVTTVVMLTEPALAADDLVRDVARTFLQMGATAIPIGVVVTVQGAIIGERELGTAAWVLSKPASRAARRQPTSCSTTSWSCGRVTRSSSTGRCCRRTAWRSTRLC